MKYILIIFIISVTTISCMDTRMQRKEKIFKAVKSQNYDYISKISKKDLEIHDINNRTPLANAVIKNDLKMIRILLDKGADINARDLFKSTPIMIAAAWGHLKAVRLLLKHGAKINDTNKYGWSVLMLAVSSGNTKLVKFLIKNKVNIFYRNKVNDNALIWASGNKYIKIKEIYGYTNVVVWGNGNRIKYKSDRETKFTIRFPLKNNPEMIKILVDAGIDINYHNKYGNTALTNSIATENFKSIKWLIKNGANINPPDKYKVKNRKIPIIEAAKNGNLEIVKYLIKNKADPTICDREKYSAYIYAVKNDRISVSKYLGNLPFNCSNYYKSELYHLVMNDDYKTMKKIDIKRYFTYKEAENALLTTIKYNDFKAFSIIVKNGVFENYNKILTKAFKSGNKKMVKMLIKYNFKLDDNKNDVYKYLLGEIKLNEIKKIPRYIDKKALITPLMIAASWQDKEFVKYLLDDKHVNINEIDTYGYNALAYSIKNGDNKLNDFLIERGAETNLSLYNGMPFSMFALENKAKKFALKLIKNMIYKLMLYYPYNKWNLLDYAAKYDAKEVLEHLFKNKVKYPEKIIENHYSPLILATIFASPETLSVLIKNGADVNEDFDTESPLMHAIRKNKYENIKFLVENGANMATEDYEWWPPLLFSARFNSIKALKFILKHSKNQNPVSSMKNNIFMIAAKRKNNVEVLRYIYSIRKIIGLDINAKNLLGENVLFHAVKRNNIKNVKFLLSIGCDHKVKNINNIDVRYIARTRGYENILKLLNTRR